MKWKFIHFSLKQKIKIIDVHRFNQSSDFVIFYFLIGCFGKCLIQSFSLELLLWGFICCLLLSKHCPTSSHIHGMVGLNSSFSSSSAPDHFWKLMECLLFQFIFLWTDLQGKVWSFLRFPSFRLNFHLQTNASRPHQQWFLIPAFSQAFFWEGQKHWHQGFSILSFRN